jgi:5-methylcytosine-specific restriction enzyme A
MPWRPLKPCSKPGCPHRVPCPLHGKRPWEHDRPSSAGRGYGAEWRKLRLRILERDRHTCTNCGKPASTVDHRKPRHLGGTDDPSNLTSLCERCHETKSAREGASVRNAQK